MISCCSLAIIPTFNRELSMGHRLQRNLMQGHDGHKETTTVTTKVPQVRCELCESVVGFVTIQFIT
jgi:hypothetical protein